MLYNAAKIIKKPHIVEKPRGVFNSPVDNPVDNPVDKKLKTYWVQMFVFTYK